MKLVPIAVGAKLARQVLLVKKNSPAIMFGAGVATAVTSTVLACKATLKFEEIMISAEDQKNQMREMAVKQPERYSADDLNKDLHLMRVQTAVKVAKLYAPAVGLGLLSLGLLTGSHITLTKRNAALTAAYAVLDKGFKEYRARVINELGEEKDKEFRFGAVEHEVVIEGPNGPEIAVVKHAPPHPGGKSIYARVFDQLNKNWSNHPADNRTFILVQQQWLNDRLRANGHLFLNDAYRALGMEDTKEGAVVGWVKDNPRGGDNYIDFGLEDETNAQLYGFMTGDEGSVWLDFNVDGVVYDLI